MSRSHRDQPGGWQNKHYAGAKPGTLKWWKGLRNSRVRAREREALSQKREPEPKYPFEHEYYD